MREIFANLILLGLAMALLFHFSLIVMWGVVTIYEPNDFILYSEVGLLIACIIFVLNNLFRRA